MVTSWPLEWEGNYIFEDASDSLDQLCQGYIDQIRYLCLVCLAMNSSLRTTGK